MIRAPPRFPFPFAAHRSLRTPPDPGITSPASGRSTRYEPSFLNTLGPNQVRRLGLELRQLEDRDLGRLVHYPRVYRIAVGHLGTWTDGNVGRPEALTASNLRDSLQRLRRLPRRG